MQMSLYVLFVSNYKTGNIQPIHHNDTMDQLVLVKREEVNFYVIFFCVRQFLYIIECGKLISHYMHDIILKIWTFRFLF